MAQGSIYANADLHVRCSMQEERMLRQLEAANTAAHLRYSVEIEQLRFALHARAKLRSLYWVCRLLFVF